MATADETTKNLPNDWAFVSDFIQDEDADENGNFAEDTMLCFSKHGTLALTFHANFNSGVVCSKCFQFMKPGSFALHCEKCNKDPAPSAKAIKEWSDSDKKWANLRRNFPEDFAIKTSVKHATRDGLSAYVVHPRFYLGKTSSTMKLKALCITDGCTHACAFNALHRHFKKAHMTANYSLHGLDILAAPTSNNVEDSSGDEDDYDEEVESAEVDVGRDEDVEETAKDEDDEGEEVESAEVDAGTDEDVEETGTGEFANNEEDVGVMKEGGGFEDDEKADEKETTDVYTSINSNERDMGKGGEEYTVGDSQDADCEPFEAEDGPSDDETSEGQERNEYKPDNSGKDEAKVKRIKSAPVRKSSRKRRAPTRYWVDSFCKGEWVRTIHTNYVLIEMMGIWAIKKS